MISVPCSGKAVGAKAAWAHVVAMMVILVACDSEAQHDLRDRISAEVSPLQEYVAFEIVLPDYLPPGIREIPAATTTDNGGGTLLMYFPPEPLSSTGPEINITESPSSERTPEPLPSFLARPTIETTRLDDAVVHIFRNDGGGIVGVSLTTSQDNVDLGLQFNWPATPDRRAEMEKEAFRVLESMLE